MWKEPTTSGLVSSDSVIQDVIYYIPYTAHPSAWIVLVTIGGREQDEAYVINVATKQLIRTFTEVDARKLLSVTHHAFFDQASDFGSYLGQTGPSSSATVETIEASTSEDTAPARDGSLSSASESTSSAKSVADDNESSDSNDGLSIAALALSCVAIAAVLASFLANKKDPASRANKGLPLTRPKADDASLAVSLAVPPSVN